MGAFTEDEWKRVFALDWSAFGLPERRDSSVVLSSFNIRVLGKVEKRSAGSWRFLAQYLQQCDLIAVQEVQDQLDALQHLHTLIGREDYGLVVSDITGASSQSPHGSERLAFFFRWRRIERTEVAADISYDKGPVLRNLLDHHSAFATAFADKHAADHRTDAEQKALENEWKAGGKIGPRPLRKSDPFVLPHFLTFIRTPHCVSFRIPGRDGARPFEFMAVNAHLLYGNKSKQKEERAMEFAALLEWIIWRTKKRDRIYYDDLILLGDLNLDFEDDDKRRPEIEALIRSLNRGILKSKDAARAYFPFIDTHPRRDKGGVFRSNARKDQTYDQIALFSHDDRLPAPGGRERAGLNPDGFDYGMFDFVELFAQAIHGRAFGSLSAAKKKALYGKFEYDVSDHMPLWVRLPVPQRGMERFDD